MQVGEFGFPLGFQSSAVLFDFGVAAVTPPTLLQHGHLVVVQRSGEHTCNCLSLIRACRLCCFAIMGQVAVTREFVSEQARTPRTPKLRSHGDAFVVDVAVQSAFVLVCFVAGVAFEASDKRIP